MTSAVGEGLTLFTDSTQMGLWEFASNLTAASRTRSCAARPAAPPRPG
jgi:hypothetical protein